jgi:hypothetical protein
MMVKTDPRARKRVRDVEEAEEREKQARFYHNFMHAFNSNEKKQAPDGDVDVETAAASANRSKHTAWRSGSPTLQPTSPIPDKPAKRRKRDKLRVDMIRRIDTPVRVNQMNVGGFLSDDSPAGGPRRSLDAAAAQDMPSNDANLLDTTITRSDSPEEMSPQEPSASARTTTPPSSPRVNNRIQIVEQASPRNRRSSLPATASDAFVSREGAGTQLHNGEVEEEAEPSSQSSDEEEDEELARQQAARRKFRRASEPAIDAARISDKSFKRVRTMDPPRVGADSGPPISSTKNFPRTQTIEIREPTINRNAAHSTALPHIGSMGGPDTMRRRTGIPLEPSTSKQSFLLIFGLANLLTLLHSPISSSRRQFGTHKDV